MTVRLPRQLTGVPPSARVHNTAAAELDACARSITVRRTHSFFPIEGGGQNGIPPNVDLTIPWQVVSSGINRGNWSATSSPFIRITESGLYLMLLQVRFPYANVGTIDTSGRRWARIMLNGNSPLSDTIGVNVALPGNRVSGTTVQAFAARNLQAGDVLQAGFRSSHVNAYYADAAAPDYGGTYFTVARMGPGAGALTPDRGGEGGVPRIESRSCPPAEALNLFASAIDNLGVCAKPRRTSGITALTANVATVISWHTDGIDTRGDMWDPAEPTKLTIRISGVYLIELQVRFPAASGSASGERWCALYRNAFSAADVLCRDDKPGSVTFEGATCVTRALVKLSAGDVLYGVMGTTVTASAAAISAGGTYLFAARVGRSGSAGTILEGTSFDPGPVPESAPVVRGDVVAAPRS